MAIAFGSRSFQDNEFNNENNVMEIVKLRHQRANLLGYDTHSHFVLEERMAMIAQYMQTYLINPPPGAKKIIVDGFDDELLRSFATATEGYSGRQISKLAIAWQAAAYGTEKATIKEKDEVLF